MQSVIVKKGRRGIEDYERHKLSRSVLAACRSVRTPDGEAEVTASEVCKRVEAWLTAKPEVTSADIRRKALEALLAYNPEAAYMYRKH
jgi:transcriptional regulator NrdR family protein